MNKIIEMRNLVSELRKADDAYYIHDAPIMSDKEYNEKYDRLGGLERETGIVFGGSPTHKVGGAVATGFQPVRHPAPMLSADKTKKIPDIVSFLAGHEGIQSYKEDGLTIITTFKDGVYVQGVSRGDSVTGEDLTDQVRQILNLPLQIPYKGDLILRGECVLPWAEFNKLEEQNPNIGHPRNIAGGAIRQHDPAVTRDKRLIFKPFKIVSGGPKFEKISEGYDWLREIGFDPVEYRIIPASCNDLSETVQASVKAFDPSRYEYPVDGIIFAYNDVAYGESLGNTEHHPRSMIALKWEDEVYPTKLKDIDFQVTKTGIISMTAVFEPVTIENTLVSRALIPNLSYFNKLKLGKTDILEIYKANKIIPSIDRNDTESGTFQLPDKCPCCGSPLRRTELNLICDNPDCAAKNVRLYEAFCRKKGLDIDGLSGKTLMKLADAGMIHNLSDILGIPYQRQQAQTVLGEKTADNIIAEIDKAKAHTPLSHLITALSIPGIGSHVGKAVAKIYGNASEYLKAMNDNPDLNIPDIGPCANLALQTWFRNNMYLFTSIATQIEDTSEEDIPVNSNSSLAGKTIVPTGTLKSFTRNTIREKIESLGAKCGDSVSKNTDYVLAGEKAGSKLDKALKLGVKVISEEEFLAMCQ